MRALTERAWAKLNLSLDVLDRRPDGYHDMRMVMQTVSLCDEVRLEALDAGGIRLKTSFSYLPADRRNLAWRAAELFFSELSKPPGGLALSIQKRIPVGAGLAGGSADAAAVLRGLNTLLGAGKTLAELERLGGRLGSDVPYCVAGGTRLATGRGEILEDLPPLPPCGVVICKPAFSIRTPELFGRVDQRQGNIRPDTDGIVSALEEGSLGGVARRMYNVFEEVLPARCAEIGLLRKRLVDEGALGAVMTGTGSAVFGLFPDPEAARRAAEKLGKSCRECFAARPVARFPETLP